MRIFVTPHSLYPPPTLSGPPLPHPFESTFKTLSFIFSLWPRELHQSDRNVGEGLCAEL